MVTAEISERLSRSGIETLSPALALQTLRLLLQRQPPGLNRFAQYVIAAVRWSRFCELFELQTPRPFLEHVRPRTRVDTLRAAAAQPGNANAVPLLRDAGSGTPCSIGCALQLPVSVYSSSRRRSARGRGHPRILGVHGCLPSNRFLLSRHGLINGAGAEKPARKGPWSPLKPTLAFDWPCAQN